MEDFWACEEAFSFTNSHDVLNHLSDPNNNLPQVIFLDYNIPDFDRNAFIEFVQQISNSIKIIVLSSHLRLEEEQELKLNPSIYNIVLKPLTVEKLLEAVQ